MRNRDEGRRFNFRRLRIGVAALAGLLLAAWAGYRLWPRTLEFHPVVLIPTWERSGDRDVVKQPGRFLVAEIGAYDDELFAYLMYQYFGGSRTFRDSEILLTYKRSGKALTYAVQVMLENDLVAALPLLARAKASGLIKQFDWRYVTDDTVRRFRYQTQVFNTAYNLTTRRKIGDMSRAELVSYVRRFVRFKSAVDRRTWGNKRSLQPLTKTQAHQLAEDIVTIADFYSLPLEFFLGIGAMENNYMNAMGDSQHAVWKNRADRGDMVLKRRGSRVLVLNPSSGVWQITRETLRYVHNLYLADRRDYSVLPEHLRPPRQLNLDEPDLEVLTTYAGLLFRKLLDLFHGDVPSAVGAYNGGPGNPNARYAGGVRTAAEHARWVMQQAAALHGEPAAGMRFLRPSR